MKKYRVFDTEKKEWIKKNIYVNTDGDLFMIKQSLFGLVKIPLALSPERYIYQEAIDLWDKNGIQVFRGDYIKAKVDEDKAVVGLVVFAHELSAYIILCDETSEFYTLGSDVCEHISVIGNVFNGYDTDDAQVE